jgi:dolichol-phosphate mannosyltransferase
MDSDLQDNQDFIEKLFTKYKEGFEIVYATREKRKESFIKRNCFSLFHRIIAIIADTPIQYNSGVFSVIGRRALNEMKKMEEHKPYVPGVRAFIGFKAIGVAVERDARKLDKGKSFFQLLHMAKETIFSHSFFPIRLISSFCILNFALSLFFLYLFLSGLFQNIFDKLNLVFFVVFSLSSIFLFFLRIMGEYIIMIFEEAKKRPRYIIEEKINL